jgi:1-acyl-sn-glycerol-3-phosphate acyltransferase
MLYRFLRWLSGVALDWFYAGIEVSGAERVPPDAPLLVVANHPNQLIDALLVARALGRRVSFTGKAVLMENPVIATLGRAIGFVPLRRVQDEAKLRGGSLAEVSGGPFASLRASPTGTVSSRGEERDTETSPTQSLRSGQAGAPQERDRNAAAFEAIVAALGARQAVLIFPEGISHDRPELAPIKTGAARIALQARDDAGVRGLHVVAVGLTFERKWAPRSRILVQIGEPLAVDGWRPSAEGGAVSELTAEVERRLRAVTLNFPTREAADSVLGASRLIAESLEREVRPLDAPDAPLPGVVDVARRAELVRRWVEDGRAPAATRERVEGFAERVGALEATLGRHGIAPSEAGVETGAAAGAWFVVREAALVALGGPVALWGRVNHWAPIALARAVARRTSRNPEDPAMHTIVAGLVLVPLFYAAQTALVWWLAGGWWALAYLVSLPPSARWALRYADRLAHARRRVRAYLLFRREPSLRAGLAAEVAWVREEAAALAREMEERTMAASAPEWRPAGAGTRATAR